MASDCSRGCKFFVRDCRRRFFASRVDDARSERCAVSGGMRIVDWIHGLHLAVGACAYVEGFDVCVCESGGRGVSGMADSARAGGSVHCDGERDCGLVSDSGDERQGEGDGGGGGIAGGGGGGVVVVTDGDAGRIRSGPPFGSAQGRLRESALVWAFPVVLECGWASCR